MIVDAENTFSQGQDVTEAASSTNIIDAGASMDIGAGAPLYVAIRATTDLTAAGTLTVDLQTSDKEDFSDAATMVSVAAIPASVINASTPQALAAFAVPSFGGKRYYRLSFTPDGVDAGKVWAGLVLEGDNIRPYASGWSIDDADLNGLAPDTDAVYPG